MSHLDLPIRRHPDAGPVRDQVAIEEPLEIRVEGTPLVVTMRTPGQDRELAAGFLYSEGVIDGADDIAALAHVQDLVSRRSQDLNVLETRLAAGTTLDPARLLSAQRSLYASSACGVCGKSTIESILRRCPPLKHPRRVPLSWLCELPEQMLKQQATHHLTGGLHAAALFSPGSTTPLVVCEDIGRHNAVDKVLGWALLRDLLPLHEHVLVVSSRAGFEITQKALMARIPVLAAVGAASSLSVSLAKAAGMQLAGFVRGGRCNEYSP